MEKILAMKNWKAYIMVWGLLFGASSCVYEEHVPEPAVADAEMRLSVSISSGTRAGDPGTDHGERNADWETLGIYVVYPDKPYLAFVIDSEDFEDSQQISQNFWVYEGTAEVYAVALPVGYELPVCSTVDDIKNMQTLIDSESGAASNENIKDIFSGISDEVTIEKGKQNKIKVSCTRLAAKIDVQWDAQGAYADGKYTNAEMSDITLDGLAQGYVFPSKVSNITYPSISENVATFTANDPISVRNGRTYFYTFPMAGQNPAGDVKKNAIRFTVTYTYNDEDGREQQKVHSYKATFDEPSNPNTWYKVNIKVNGTTASATEGNHELVLTQTQSGN